MQEVVGSARKELSESHKLERAKEQVGDQRSSLKREIEDLSKLRKAQDSERNALQQVVEDYGRDSESLRSNLAGLTDLTKSLRENAEAMAHSTSEVLGQLQNELSKISDAQNEALKSLVKKRQGLSAALQGLTSLSRELPKQFAQIGIQVAALTQEVESKWKELASSAQKLHTVAERVAEERVALIDSTPDPLAPLMESERETCPSCGRTIFSNDAFCDRCGAALKTCPSCASAVNQNESFCHSCGTPLKREEEPNSVTRSIDG